MNPLAKFHEQIKGENITKSEAQIESGLEIFLLYLVLFCS